MSRSRLLPIAVAPRRGRYNRKDAPDAALIGLGRIDKNVKFKVPTQEEMKKLLAVYTSRMSLATNVGIQQLAAQLKEHSTLQSCQLLPLRSFFLCLLH
uniref:Uncharacterized protein n=1 Tax=Peronospora matthiolae TaxID=2874970 RepID=A0AAV1UUD1_9STRA